MVRKISNTNSCGCVCVGGGRGVEKTENFNSRSGWLLNCFFLSFSNHENYTIKNICVYSKSKIKTKETNRPNLEYFKMINRRFFIHKFCNNSKMLLSPFWAMFMETLCFYFYQWPTFLCLSTCVFRFY